MNVYFGWYLVAALFVVLMAGSGLGFYNHSVYLNALSVERGWSLGALSGAVSLFFVVSGVSGVFVARWMARFDVRWVMSAGALLFGAALLALADADTLLKVYMAYALLGLGYACVGLVPSTTLIARWFTQRRSVALSLASTGLSVGGVVVTPWCASAIREFGVARVLPWLALGFVLLVLPMVALLRAHPPDAIGGRSHTAGGSAKFAGAHEGVPYSVAVKARYFWLLTAAFVLLMLSQVGGIAHQFTLAAERFEVAAAATAVAVLASGSIVGRLLGGVVLLRVSSYSFALLNIVGQIFGLALLAWAPSVGWLWCGSLVFGLSVGNLLMLQPLILGEVFGVRDYARIYAVSQALTTFGVALGPLAMGIGHDWLNYGFAFGAAAFTSMLAFMLFVATPRARAKLPDSSPSAVGGAATSLPS